EDVLQNPLSPNDGRGSIRIRGGHQNRAFAEQPAANAVRRQGHTLEARALHTGDAIVPGEALVQERVIGVEQVSDWTILANEAAKEQVHFLLERLAQVVVEMEKRFGTRLMCPNVADVQPLSREVVDERLRFRVG